MAMESDDLLNRTAQYQIQYLPGRGPRRGTVVFRHEEEGSIRLHSRPLRAYSYGADDDEDDDYRTAQIPAEFAAAPPPFIITTECSDDDSEGDRIPRPRPPHRRAPNRIGTLPFEREGDSSDESIEIWGQSSREWPVFEEITTRRHYPATYSRVRGGRGTGGGGSGSGSGSGSATASGLTLEEAQEASQLATQEAVRAVGGELMTPLAHFFIEKDKNKCTVRFDPPVSGRFILLKMWSPHQDVHDRPPNIDIQAVIAKGFAGPRFTPAVELA